MLVPACIAARGAFLIIIAVAGFSALFVTPSCAAPSRSTLVIAGSWLALEVSNAVVTKEGTLPSRKGADFTELDVTSSCHFVADPPVEEDNSVMDVRPGGCE